MRDWRAIIAVWALGVLAAAQLAKFAALLPLLRGDLHIGLVEAGWLVSLIEGCGAVLGLAAGLASGRVGSSRALSLGLGLIAISGLAEGLSPNISSLFAARVAEGGGYLLVVVAAPSLIAFVAANRNRAAALALWSTFVPAGLGLGTALTGIASMSLGWRGICLAWAAISAVAFIFSLALPRTSAARLRLAVPRPPVWALGASFACYTAINVGLLAMLPSYLTSQWQLAPSLAATITGIASAVTIAGSFAAGLILRRSATQALVWSVAVGSCLPALALFLAFPAGDGAGILGLGGVIAADIVANAAWGLVPATTFARVPDTVDGSSDPALAIPAANGVLAQFGAAGSLFGPPLVGLVVQQWGWSGVGPFAVILAVLSIGLVLISARLHSASVDANGLIS